MQRISALVAFFALTFCIACGGNGSSSDGGSINNSGSGGTNSGSSSGTGGGSSLAGTYVYVANQGAGTISGFRLGTDGSLTASGTPIASPGIQRLTTVGNRFLVAAERTGSDLHLFSISQSTGALRQSLPLN